jgi:hypothetical protein
MYVSTLSVCFEGDCICVKFKSVCCCCFVFMRSGMPLLVLSCLILLCLSDDERMWMRLYARVRVNTSLIHNLLMKSNDPYSVCLFLFFDVIFFPNFTWTVGIFFLQFHLWWTSPSPCWHTICHTSPTIWNMLISAFLWRHAPQSIIQALKFVLFLFFLSFQRWVY